MTDDTLEIQIGEGFAKLLIYPTSLKTDGDTTTAEVITDWIPSHMELSKAAGGEATFRIRGRTARCTVRLSMPFLQVEKVAFQRLMLVELP